VRRPPLRSVPASSRSPRAPFVVLVLLVLGMGLIGLLLLNTSLQQGSFVLEELQTQAELLRDRQSTLTDEVAGRSAPDALAHQAVQLGMVTAEAPLFLEVPENARGSANGAR
jgi:hypothetical protein